MGYRGLALDLDDTLLGPQGKVSDVARGAVARAQKVGATVVLATGRPHTSAEKFAARLGIEGPIVANSGSVITDGGDAYLRQLTLPGRLCRGVYASLRATKNHLLYVYTPDGIFASRDAPDVKRYAKVLDVPIEIRPQELIEGRVFALCARVPPEDGDELETHWSEKLKGRAQVIHSIPSLVEFLPAEASKGRALQYLSRYTDIPISQWVAVGDSRGDLDMLRAAGLGALVGNAPESLHQEADWVASAPYTWGVSQVVQRFFDSGDNGKGGGA